MSVSNGNAAGRRWKFGACEYSEAGRTLSVDGVLVKVEGKPLDVLLQLLEHTEHTSEVCTKDHLLDTVWPDVETTEQCLTVAVSKLRKAIGGPRDSVILNVAGIGYRLAVSVVCSVEKVQDPPLFALKPGDPIPRRPHWHAVGPLSDDKNSAVWLARHEKNQEERVYKFAVDGIRLRALQREVASYRLLTRSLGEHPSFLVRLLDWDFDTAPFFIESEYSGPNLLEWSKTDAFLSTSVSDRVRLVASLAAGIASAHSVAIFHNDLKPSNILIAPGTPKAQMKIADFGVASLQDLTLLSKFDISDQGAFDDADERRTAPSGTAMYRAPELHGGGTPTAQGDVYSLGILLYQLVCGEFYESPSPGWEQKIQDPLLRRDIADAANMNLAQRIPTVDELAGRLKRLEARRTEEEWQAAAAEKAQAAQQALARARLRRPWVVLTIVLLVFGLTVSLWSAHRMFRDRDALRRSNASLKSMYDFLAIDLLGQSNPYLSLAGPGRASQQTLLEAIATATPQIDSRFSSQPEVAARLHETVADSLRSRTQYREAAHQYAVAARDFRTAQGPLSQDAIIAELKGEFDALAGQLPGSVDEAKQGFARQQVLIDQLHRPTAELQSWQAIVHTIVTGLGSHPENALPMLKAAVERAEATPGFDPLLLVRMKGIFAGTYVRLGDGVNLERTSKEVIAILSHQFGSESPRLLPFQMYLEESYYLQGRYADTITQADQNYSRFNLVLGPQNQLTLATLSTRAAAEAQLGRYADAVRDDLTLYAAELPLPSGRRIGEGALSDAALFECRRGNFRDGIQYARQVIADTGSGPSPQPMFMNQSMLTVAECEIDEQRTHPTSDKVRVLNEAATLLNTVDLAATAEDTGDARYQSAYNLARAQLALLRGQFTDSRRYVAAAVPLLSRKDADPYEKKALEWVRTSLADRGN
jgi:eukaryotic-like serine/threonine-protein kinase